MLLASLSCTAQGTNASACPVSSPRISSPNRPPFSRNGARQAEIDKVATRGYFYFMKCIGVKELKNNLSAYLRVIANGESILVTDRQRVIAELIPPREGVSAIEADAALAEAARCGWLTPAVEGPGSPPPRRPLARLKNILKELEEDRAER